MMFNRTFVRIYQMPDKLINGMCMASGVPITFRNVDWFETSIDGLDAPQRLIEYVKGKPYYMPDVEFLVLGDHPDFTFRIPAEVAA